MLILGQAPGVNKMNKMFKKVYLLLNYSIFTFLVFLVKNVFMVFTVIWLGSEKSYFLLSLFLGLSLGGTNASIGIIQFI